MKSAISRRAAASVPAAVALPTVGEHFCGGNRVEPAHFVVVFDHGPGGASREAKGSSLSIQRLVAGLDQSLRDLGQGVMSRYKVGGSFREVFHGYPPFAAQKER